MGRSYKVTGINLKAAPLGEQDRLLTILTPERGLLRVVAGGARKAKSSLAGRSNLFVVNQLVIAPGRSLDRITQAETIESFPRFSQDLTRLTAAQYLAEVALFQALDDHPQPELFDLLQGHLDRLHTAPSAEVLPRLIQGLFHLLTLAGLAPQVFHCCRSQQPLDPQFEDPYWRAGFSVTGGGVVALHLAGTDNSDGRADSDGQTTSDRGANRAGGGHSTQAAATDPIAEPILWTREPELDERVNPPDRTPVIPLTAGELQSLQSLAQLDFPSSATAAGSGHPAPSDRESPPNPRSTVPPPIPRPNATIAQPAIQAPVARSPRAPLPSNPPLPPPFRGFPQLRSQPPSSAPTSPSSPAVSPASTGAATGHTPDLASSRGLAGAPQPLPMSSRAIGPRAVNLDQGGSPSSRVEDGPLVSTGSVPSQPVQSSPSGPSASPVWLHLEGILRQYIQHHFDRPLRSAQLMDTCFATPPESLPQRSSGPRPIR